jgi:hypothetical protein
MYYYIQTPTGQYLRQLITNSATGHTRAVFTNQKTDAGLFTPSDILTITGENGLCRLIRRPFKLLLINLAGQQLRPIYVIDNN